jgi:GntR family transcriptional regulator
MVKRTGQPGYLQIADELRKQVADGSLGPGDVLPSIAQLSERYEVSASVVKSAISVLRTEGLVVGQQGKGVFIRDRSESEPPAPPEEDGVLMEQLAEVLTAVRELGERVGRLEQTVFPEPKRTPRPGK